ncbi:MAG: ABC transporter ATP-binding protein [Methylococcaceae bacterium]|nr:ABC transporter ATP-binding protein [Methylococcaceae bacterium]
MIRLNGINRNFTVGDQIVHALKDVDLAIAAGEYVSVMGPSGSGKSTLLNTISLLDRPSFGNYELNGKNVTDLSDQELARVRRENIGFVFQFFHLIARLTAAENIEMPLILAGVDRNQRTQRVEQAIAAYGLGNRADHRPDQLSGGQRQRVAIARATIMRPGIILADEPTGNLDRHSGIEIVDLLERLNRDGVTLLVVTHDPALGKRAARRITMVDGAIVSDSLAGSTD